MTDIHSHIIYQVDDGAESIDKSIRMLEQAVEAGIKNVIATPHISEVTTADHSAKIMDHFHRLQETVHVKNMDIRIYTGSELYFNEYILNWNKTEWYTFNNNKKFLLFELPLFDLPIRVSDFIFQCKLQGITPILAHPERYIHLHSRPEIIGSWIDIGCLMQLNAGSLTGIFGKKILRITEKWLKKRFFHFMASDAHDLAERSFRVMGEAAERLKNLVDQEYYNELTDNNPSKALRGVYIAGNISQLASLVQNPIKKLLNKIKISR